MRSNPALFLLTALGLAASAGAQAAPYTNEQLEELVVVIAGYPASAHDTILEACGHTSSIVEAAALVRVLGPGRADRPHWPASIRELAADYPAVLFTLEKNLPVAANLGTAYHLQKGDVEAALERVRAEQALVPRTADGDSVPPIDPETGIPERGVAARFQRYLRESQARHRAIEARRQLLGRDTQTTDEIAREVEEAIAERDEAYHRAVAEADLAAARRAAEMKEHFDRIQRRVVSDPRTTVPGRDLFRDVFEGTREVDLDRKSAEVREWRDRKYRYSSQRAPKRRDPKVRAPKIRLPKRAQPTRASPTIRDPKARAPKARDPKQREPKRAEPTRREPKRRDPKRAIDDPDR